MLKWSRFSLCFYSHIMYTYVRVIKYLHLHTHVELMSVHMLLLLPRLLQRLSGWYVSHAWEEHVYIYDRLIECWFESDDRTARTVGRYRRRGRARLVIAIKNTRDNRLDYLLIRSAFVPYKIALTSPFRRPHCEKMNLIFRLIVGQREKRDTPGLVTVMAI